jgi:hypothetical protein
LIFVDAKVIQASGCALLQMRKRFEEMRNHVKAEGELPVHFLKAEEKELISLKPSR